MLGIVERDGELRTIHVPNAKAKTLQGEVIKNVAKGAAILTDEDRSSAGAQVVRSAAPLPRPRRTHFKPSPPGRTRRVVLDAHAANWPVFAPPEWPVFTPPLTLSHRR